LKRKTKFAENLMLKRIRKKELTYSGAQGGSGNTSLERKAKGKDYRTSKEENLCICTVLHSVSRRSGRN